MQDMLLWLVIAPILVGVFLYIFPLEKIGKIIAIIIQAVLVCAAFYLFFLTRNAPDGQIIQNIGNFQGVMGIRLKIDSLSAAFVILTAFIFLFAAIYSFREDLNRLTWFLLFVWEGLLLGIFLSNDFFNIFVLKEVAAVVVSIHIMLKRYNRSMYDGMIYLMINTVAMQFYLFGVGYIYRLTGVLDLDAASSVLSGLDRSQLILPYALIITTICLKCALVPLYGWLPKAHGTPGAPAYVSAILSGLHVKAGIYLFVRFQDLFQVVAPANFFLVIGIITGVVGFFMALSQSDIKLLLAYSTISQIGLVMIGLNVSNDNAYAGALFHIINHALFKSTLFLCAGVIINTYGTRGISKIRGVFHRMPLVGVAILMAIFGITGTPFFNGSISKYFITYGTNWVTYGAIMLINLGTIITFIKFSTMLFGRCESSGAAAVKIDGCQQIAVFLLGASCLLGGIFGEQLIWYLFSFDVSVDAIGYLEKVALFAVSVVAGLLIYRFFVKDNKVLKKISGLEMSFQGNCVFLGIFFAFVLIIVRVLV